MTTRSSHRSRWKKVEVRVADLLTEAFSDVGKEPVTRIPILGRTGPDITHNDVQLIVDVKSRLKVPKKSLAVSGKMVEIDDMLGFQLQDLLRFNHLPTLKALSSPLVSEWMSHMHEWKVAQEPQGITCVVLHRPGMPIGDSTVIIYSNERNKLWTRLTA